MPRQIAEIQKILSSNKLREDFIMLLISRKRTPDQMRWERSVVTVEGDTSKRGPINSLEIGNYPKWTESGEKVIYTPLETKLYLLDYLMVVHKEETIPTVQQVLEAFEQAPDDIRGKAYAFEFQHGFYDFAATDFFDLEELGIWVTFVAVLTKEDTGKELPGVRLKFSKPIGIADDQWETLCRKYSAPFYDYIEQ